MKLRVFPALALAWALAGASTAAWSQAAGATTAPVNAAIAFDFVQDRQILFPITVNGRPAEAWLDSGASATVIDTAFARKLGLKLKGRVRARGVADPIGGVRLAHADLDVAHLQLNDRPVAVMDLSAVSRVVQRPVQVILGREVFDEAVVEVDFAQRTIAFQPNRGFRPPPGAPLGLVRSGDLRSFVIAIAGAPVEAVFDLGNAGGLLVDRDFAQGRGLLAGRVSTQLAVGADGARESAVTSLDRVEVAGVVLNGVPTAAVQGLASHAQANVGLAILRRYHLTIDFAGDRMWLRPDADAATQAFRKNRAGLAVTPQQGRYLRVTHVALGSPAQAAGWKVGELIRSIDGQAIDPGYPASALSRWTFGPPGQVVALTLADGSRRLLSLAEYY